MGLSERIKFVASACYINVKKTKDWAKRDYYIITYKGCDGLEAYYYPENRSLEYCVPGDNSECPIRIPINELDSLREFIHTLIDENEDDYDFQHKLDILDLSSKFDFKGVIDNINHGYVISLDNYLRATIYINKDPKLSNVEYSLETDAPNPVIDPEDLELMQKLIKWLNINEE